MQEEDLIFRELTYGSSKPKNSNKSIEELFVYTLLIWHKTIFKFLLHVFPNVFQTKPQSSDTPASKVSAFTAPKPSQWIDEDFFSEPKKQAPEKEDKKSQKSFISRMPSLTPAEVCYYLIISV